MQKTHGFIILLLIHQVLVTSGISINSKTYSSQRRKRVIVTEQPVNERISEIKCREYVRDFKCTIPADIRNNGNPFVEDALSVNYPYMALLLTKTDGKYEVTCDGTLISPRFILTVAHCSESIFQPRKQISLVARLGDHIANYAAFDGINQVEVPVASVYKHPKYTTRYSYHDIGLLELAQDVSFTEFIRPACLWNGLQFSDNDGSVTSWTAFNSYDGVHPKELQKFDVRIITNDECVKRGYGSVIDTQVCTVLPSGFNKTCLKYAGAPLQVMTTLNPCITQVYGVTSYSSEICGNVPSVFARVSSYLDWIEHIVWSKTV